MNEHEYRFNLNFSLVSATRLKPDQALCEPLRQLLRGDTSALIGADLISGPPAHEEWDFDEVTEIINDLKSQGDKP